MNLTPEETKLVKNLVLANATLAARRAARDLCERTGRNGRYSSELPKALENLQNALAHVTKSIDIANRI